MPLCCCGLACVLNTSLIIACECALACVSSICCVCPPCGCTLWCCEIAVSVCFITILASSYLIFSACECAACSCLCFFGVLCSISLIWIGYLFCIAAVICSVICSLPITIAFCLVIYVASILTSLIWIPLFAIVGIIAVPFICVLQILGGAIAEILSFFFFGVWPSWWLQSIFCPILLVLPCVCTIFPYFAPLLFIVFSFVFALWAASFSGSLPVICTVIPSVIAVIISIIFYPVLLVLVLITPIFALPCACLHPIYLLLLGAVGIVAFPCAVCACWIVLYEIVSAFVPIIYLVTGIAGIIFGAIQVILSFIVIGVVIAWPGLALNGAVLVAYLVISVLCSPITLICLPVWAIVLNALVTLELVFLVGSTSFVGVLFLALGVIIPLAIGVIWYFVILSPTLPCISTAVVWIPVVAIFSSVCIVVSLLASLICCCACIQTNICLLPCYWVLSIICGICTALCASPFAPFIVCGIISAGLLAYTGMFFAIVLFTMMLDAVFLLAVSAIDVLMVLMLPLGACVISSVAFMFAFLPIYLVAYTIVPPMVVVFLMASVTIACTYPPMTWCCIIPSTACILPCVALFAFQIVIFSSVLTAILIPFICSLVWAMQNPIICATCFSAIVIVACATLSPGLLAIALMSPPIVCGSAAFAGLGIAGVAVGGAFYMVSQTVCGASGCIPNVGGLLTTVLGDVLVSPTVDLVSTIIDHTFTSTVGIINTCAGDIDSYIGTIGSHWCGVDLITDSIATLVKAVDSGMEVVEKVTKMGGV